jgi:hypothetical protein
MKDWKSKLSLSRVGEKVDLKTAEGFWVKPQKFTVEQNDEIQSAQLRALTGVNRGTLAKATNKIKLASENNEETTAIDVLSDEDISALMDAKFAPSSEVLRLHILYGIAEHNFCEEESSTVVDKALVDDLMKYPDIATEIGGAARRYNSPLAQPTSTTSETSPDGSTEGQNLK